MEFPLDVNCCFSFAAFNIFFVVFILCLINMCLGMFLLGFILCLVVPLGLDWLFPFPCWRNFQLYSLQKCSHTLSLSLLHLGSLQLECAAFDIVPEVSEPIPSSFHSFYFILLFRSYFHHFIFQLTDSFFCFRYSAIDSF